MRPIYDARRFAFARLLDAPPEWVLNTLRALDLAPRDTLARAQQFTIMRAGHEGAGMPLPAAYALIGRALSSWSGGTECATLQATASDDVALTLDVYRLLSSARSASRRIPRALRDRRICSTPSFRSESQADALVREVAATHEPHVAGRS